MKRVLKNLPQLSLLFLYFVLSGNPSSAQADFTHSVKAGETLYSISKKYHIPVGQIQDANEIGDEKLQPGQSLTLPGSKPDGSKNTKAKKTAPVESRGAGGVEPGIPPTHRVKKGETLASIAKKYNLGPDDLSAINGLKGKKIKTGQVLRLRLADDEEDLGSEDATSKEDPAENREIAAAYVPGSGFLLSEKNRELLARVAKSFLGFRYTRGGSSINGMDCSSYVQRVYKVFGIDLPRTAREQFQVGYDVGRNALRAGDLVFFKRSQNRQPAHVGIYIGDNQFIHTSQKKRQVEVDSLESRYFIQRFMGAKRIEEMENGAGENNPTGE
jgi:peptidoglycan DL-endopeptidase LytE